MHKNRKIFAVVEPDLELRRRLIQRMAVELGFALTSGDAGKIIRKSIYDVNLLSSYFVLVESFDFRAAPGITQRLFEMATSGLAVVVGVKKLPPSFDIFCETIYRDSF